MSDAPALAGFARSAALDGEGVVRPVSGEDLVVARAGRRLLDIPEIQFTGTDITVVMGPNGAGKSLLLKVLAGLVAPDAGRVRWAGAPPNRRRAPRLGFVFQKPVLLRRSALANMVYALKAAGIGDARARAREALEHAGLLDLAHAPARVLSGGEQQRLALARALALRPEILFLDEPTASLDPAATLAIERLAAEAPARGTKLVLVSHDIGQAKRLAAEIVFMHRGRIAERTPAGAFFEEPTSPQARAYLAGEILI
jgi:tungstate transport system ATP-binding protein